VISDKKFDIGVIFIIKITIKRVIANPIKI